MDNKRRLKIGVAGCGLIAQVEHIPNLLALPDMFQLVAISDPSQTVREALSVRFGVPAVADVDALFDGGLDALMVCAPDAWHGALVEAALEKGLHVFTEKPLCYSAAEIDALMAIEQRTGLVVQVGYMKRFDPSYRAALDYVAGKGDKLRAISVEVNDPDAGPFVGHHPLVAGADVSPALVAETGERKDRQVAAALGVTPGPILAKGFAGPFCSSLVHDVNAVHGLLDAMGIVPGAPLDAAIFADGTAAQGAVDLRGGRALWNMVYLELPAVGFYRERISLYFDDEVVELVFPAPYLNHFPTRLTVTRRGNGDIETIDIRSGFEEPFVLELKAFWASITQSAPRINTMSEARRDQVLLRALALKAAKHLP
jgi:predicted dehydrogenase